MAAIRDVCTFYERTTCENCGVKDCPGDENSYTCYRWEPFHGDIHPPFPCLAQGSTYWQYHMCKGCNWEKEEKINGTK